MSTLTHAEAEELQALAAECDLIAKHIRLRGCYGHNRIYLSTVQERLARLIIHINNFMPVNSEIPRAEGVDGTRVV